ncbi:GDSL family lipase [Mesotoga sp. H07.pep.5.3]|nr:SGNH/GDSL hydrolase family protein [Mesotoga sp. HF07.pep.5.2.highcov]PIJ61377.1 GDSL family lipase [Mesotoga sp. H07.pep.5.3]
MKRVFLREGQRVLFQGDSVTDTDRDREDLYSLGDGYPAIISGLVGSAHPELRIEFLNRGVGGDRVRDLRRRWEVDCLDLSPDWVSILVGINDCWRLYDSDDKTEPEDFENDYRYLLESVRSKGASVIIMEPFFLPVFSGMERWTEDLGPKIQIIRRVAREFGAIYLPLDGIFAAASARCEPEFWAKDGVHPTPEGHALIARHWLQAMNIVL